MKKSIFIVLYFLFAANTLWAKANPKKYFDHPKSACQVKQFGGGDGGDYPTFEIYKNGKSIYTIDCDCGVSVLFSPSGKYIAFGNSEMDTFERKGNLMIYNCDSGTKKTFIPSGCSKESGNEVCIAYAIPTKWSMDETALNYKSYIDGKDLKAKLIFDSKNSRP